MTYDNIMIRLTITDVIFFYTLLTVITILIVWVVSGYKSIKPFITKDIDYIWKCSVCSNTYVDSKHENISVCPLCSSYNKREEGRIR